MANTVITQNLVAMYPINTKYYTVNLAVAAWNSSTKSQTVSCAGISGDEDSQEIFVSANAASGEDNLTAFDAAGVYVSGVAEGEITVTCFNLPDNIIIVDIAIQQVAPPPRVSYITFSSPSGFSVGRGSKGWSNELQYSTDRRNWFTWDGVTVLNSVDNKLYLRGINNTYVRGPLVLTGENISCKGNIESLLDYQAAINGEYPTTANNCFGRLFDGATALVQAPDLPRLTLAVSFYTRMFAGTGLTKAPNLPATTLGNLCYSSMFANCLLLVEPPQLMADTLTPSCYQGMFSGCASLTKAPELPAIELAAGCYGRMFENCTSLVELPMLSALTMPSICYQRMFAGCASVKLSKEKTGTFTKEYRIPFEGTGTLETGNSANQMFYGTVFAEEVSLRTPEINTTYYLDESNSIVPPPVSKGETWEIKESPQLFAGNTFNLGFTSNQQSFNKIVFEEETKFHTYLYYDDVEVADASGSSVYIFSDAAYRTVTFDSPVTDSKLLTWLQNNALKA